MDLHGAHQAFASLEHYLNPEVWADRDRHDAIAAGLRAGRLVVVRDALRPALAEQVHQCLVDATNWQITDSYEHPELCRHDVRDFNYRHHNIRAPAPGQDALILCREIFRSPASGAFIGDLAGLSCRAPAAIVATWYRPGDHSFPHSYEVI